MDNIPEIEQPKAEDQREGIAPFEGGIKKQVKDSLSSLILYKDFSLVDVGEFAMRFEKPHNERLDFTANIDEAYTIDLTGTIKKGILRDFYKAGYYKVRLIEIEKESLEREAVAVNDQQPKHQKLNINLWIDNTKTAISTPLIDDYQPRYATFQRRTPKTYGKAPIFEHFVLPNDPALLQAIRLNVSSE